LEIIKLKARARTGIGKSYASKLRNTGWIPAVYYGHNMKPENIEINGKEFSVILRAGKATHLIDLCLSEAEGESVAIIKEIQREVIFSDRIQHVDFQHTSLNEEVTVLVPLVFTGTSIGVMQDDGILNHPSQSLSVICLARNIPEHITVDVSGLHVGESIHIKDISIPDGKFAHAPEEVVVSVTRAKAVEEVAVAAAPAEGAAPAAGTEAAAAEGAGDKKASDKKPAEKKDEKSGDKAAKGGESKGKAK
jgi:large subunit ribosomal protein L25